MDKIAIITNSVRVYREILKLNKLNPIDCIHVYSEDRARGLTPSSYFQAYGFMEVKNCWDIVERFEIRGAKNNTNLIDF